MAGATAQRVYKPKISPGEYPVMNTRPLSSMVTHDHAACRATVAENH